MQTKTFLQIRKKVFGTIIFVLKTAKKGLPGSGLMCEFSKSDGDSFIFGLSMENGIVGFLQASNFESTDQVSLLLVAILDTMSKTVDKSEITILFDRFCEFISLIHKDNLEPA